MKKLIPVLILLVLVAIPAMAQTASDPLMLDPSTYISPRVYAMGGAYTALALGFDGMFFNPAGYSQPKNNHFGLLDINLLANYDFIQLAQSTQFFSQITNMMSDSTFLANLLKAKLAGGFSGIPFIGIMLGGFAVGVYDTMHVTAAFIPTIAFPDVKLSVTADVGAIIGYSLNIGNFLYIGANAKMLIRAWTDKQENLLQFIDDMSSGMQNGGLPFAVNIGKGYGFDVGAIMKLGALQVGVSWLNIGGMTIRYKKITDLSNMDNVLQTLDTDLYAYIPEQINVGVALNIGKIIPFLIDRVHVMADVRGINLFIDDVTKYGWNFALVGKYLYMGAEFSTLEIITVRGGLYQGYPTLGLSVNLLLCTLSATYYTEEMGNFPGTIPQNNFIVSVSFMW